jgi:predicted amidohydrolase
VEFRVALAQIAPRLGEVDANLELAAERITAARGEGADLVVFPELALTGYLLQDLVPEVAMAADDHRLGALSREAPGTLIAVGFVEETADHRYCNSAALLRDGELVGLHRKVYLPTYGLFDEARFTSEGDRIRTYDVGPPIGRIGLSVCEDFWHPFVPMLQAHDGASLLVNIAAGPSRAPGSEAGMVAITGWHKMQDTYALLGTVALAFCNRVGNEEGLTFWGGSRLLAADGSVAAEAPLWEEALVVGTLDTDDVRMQRYSLPILADERPELTRRELDRIIAERAGLPAPDEMTAEADEPHRAAAGSVPVSRSDLPAASRTPDAVS